MMGYKTAQERAVADVEVRKSRFIASLCPVDNEEEALVFIRDVRLKYRDARHNVYAYDIIGTAAVAHCGENQSGSGIRKFSDDGEPSGTAGYPVLEMIKSNGISDIVIVVSRYFGGILLGTAGLARAYAGCSKAVLEKAGDADKVLCRKIELKTDYHYWGKVRDAITGEGFHMADTEYSDGVTARVYIPVNLEDRFGRTVMEASGGSAKVGKLPGNYLVVTGGGRIIRITGV